LRCRESEGLEPQPKKEQAMILAFALAILGAIVLGSLEIAAHVH
jgi:hypothetical protein